MGEVTGVRRTERLHYLLEDADFSRYRITTSISGGEDDAKRILGTKGGRGDSPKNKQGRKNQKLISK